MTYYDRLLSRLKDDDLECVSDPTSAIQIFTGRGVTVKIELMEK